MKLFSPSRLSAYETCPLQYRYRYVDRKAVEEETIEAFLGSRVHEALEKLYDDLNHAVKPDRESIINYYDLEWDRRWEGKIRIVNGQYKPEDYRRMGRNYIGSYYRRFYPFEDSKTLALEEKLVFPLDEERTYGIIGIVDRLAQTEDGTVEIHDYKTSGTLPPQEKLDADRQLGLYQIGVMGKWPQFGNIRLVWHYLAHDVDMESRRTTGELRELKKETLALVRQIDACSEFPPRESSLCPWCLYRSICPLFAHEVRVSALLPESHDLDEGVLLADRYLKLKKSEKILQDEIREVEEDIFRYADRHGVMALAGNMGRLKIIGVAETSYPLKGEPGREELERLLMNGGVWPEVSSLNGKALAKAVRESGWDRELVDKVREFEIVKEKRYIRKSR